MTLGVGAIYHVYKNDEYVGDTKNLLTDGFFSRAFGATNSDDQEVGFQICIFVGTGTTEPLRTDTGMEANVASSGIIAQQDGGNFDYYLSSRTVSGRYYKGSTWTHTFSAGTFSGQAITELGARWSDSTGTAHSKNSPLVIDSHALIRRADGTVQPVILQSTDSLTVRVEFWQQYPDMRYDPSRVVIQGVATDVTFGFVNAGDSIARRNHAILNGYYDTFFTSTPFFLLAKYNGATYTYNHAGIDRSATTVTRHDPTTTDATILPLSRIGNSTLNTTEFMGFDVADRAFGVRYNISINQTDINTGLAAIYIAGRGDDNNLTWMHCGFHFDPPLTGITAGSTISIPVTFKYGEYERFGFEDTLRAEIQSATITETAPNGAYTTLRKGDVRAFGGKQPYSFAWAYVSGGSALLSADSPSDKGTTFTGTGTSQQSVELWRCTVTDANSDTATVDVTVDVTWS